MPAIVQVAFVAIIDTFAHHYARLASPHSLAGRALARAGRGIETEVGGCIIPTRLFYFGLMPLVVLESRVTCTEALLGDVGINVRLLAKGDVVVVVESRVRG